MTIEYAFGTAIIDPDVGEEVAYAREARDRAMVEALTVPDPFPGWDAVTDETGKLPMWASVDPVRSEHFPRIDGWNGARGPYPADEAVLSMSATGWSAFGIATGLTNLLDEWFRDDVCVVRLTHRHQDDVRAALADFRARHRGMRPDAKGDHAHVYLALLVRMDFWIETALRHCETPCVRRT